MIAYKDGWVCHPQLIIMIQMEMAHTLLMMVDKTMAQRWREMKSLWRWLCMAMAMYDKKLHVVVVARLSRGSET